MNIKLLSAKQVALAAESFIKAKLLAEATPFEVNQALEHDPDSLVVVDVRDRPAYEREHVRGAISVPAEELVHVYASLPKEVRVVTYCWDLSCSLAPKAALELLQKGYKAQYMAGGIEEWKRKGFSLEKPLHSERSL